MTNDEKEFYLILMGWTKEVLKDIWWFPPLDLRVAGKYSMTRNIDHAVQFQKEEDAGLSIS